VANGETHFFKGTVPWGPCPAPFRASVTRQVTMLYAESSSTILQNYVKRASQNFPGLGLSRLILFHLAYVASFRQLCSFVAISVLGLPMPRLNYHQGFLSFYIATVAASPATPACRTFPVAQLRLLLLQFRVLIYNDCPALNSIIPKSDLRSHRGLGQQPVYKCF
jgi:hypothetical protein